MTSSTVLPASDRASSSVYARCGPSQPFSDASPRPMTPSSSVTRMKNQLVFSDTLRMSGSTRASFIGLFALDGNAGGRDARRRAMAHGAALHDRFLATEPLYHRALVGAREFFHGVDIDDGAQLRFACGELPLQLGMRSQI